MTLKVFLVFLAIYPIVLAKILLSREGWCNLINSNSTGFLNFLLKNAHKACNCADLDFSKLTNLILACLFTNFLPSSATALRTD